MSSSSNNGQPFHPRTGFRKRVLAGELTLGMTCTSGAPQLVEIMGFCGLDYVMIDTEHSDAALVAETAALIRAADAAGIPALVRVDAARPESILHVLDYGAIGIVAPHIQTPADARALVAAAKYHPEGNRGICPQIRAMRYGGYSDWNAYWPIANAETLVIALIEDPVGMEHIDEIASTPGIDAIWVGLADLGQALGLSGNMNHPRLLAAKKRGQTAALAAGKRCMVGVPSNALAETLPAAIEEGYSLVMVSCDTNVFAEAVRNLVSIATKSRNAGGGETVRFNTR